MKETLWSLAQKCEKYQEDGLWGLRSHQGGLLLEPKYDQIEVCEDHVFARFWERYKIFHKDGWTSEASIDNLGHIFYENGHLGLHDGHGNALFPAEYDEIYEWRDGCDVICVRKGCDVRYYNHKEEEILMGLRPLLSNNCLMSLDSIAGRKKDEMMICVEPIKENSTDRDCFACGQWVRLSVLPCAKVRELFTGCALKSVPEQAIRHFEHDATYDFSARVCTSEGEYPISSCIEKFKRLKVFDCSWEYFFKISINSKTKISTHDIYKTIKHFENLDSKWGGTCISIHYAVDFDDSLEIGSVRVLLVQFYWDCFFRESYALSDGTVDDVKAVLSQIDISDREEFIRVGFFNVEYSAERGWEETEKVLEFLKRNGADVSDILDSQLDINYSWMEEITPEAWQFKRKMVDWALCNGAQINRMSSSMTYLDLLRKCLSRCDNQNCATDEAKVSRLNGKKFAKWLKSKGAVSFKVQRRRVESRLDGLSALEVFDVVKSV